MRCPCYVQQLRNFCLVIIEAFACGKPVITSNAGAIKTYMKPELGIMVDKGNEQQLTKAILVFAKIIRSLIAIIYDTIPLKIIATKR